MANYTPTDSQISLAVAIIIILFWFASLIKFLTLDISQTSPALVIFGFFLRSFLHTGLFITTHEAIHGLIFGDRKINRAIGHITSFLYAFLSYKALTKNHRLHHRYPASAQDPDFDASNNFLLWYFNFMKEYQRGGQAGISVLGMAIVFGFLIGLQISLLNILLFWVTPIIFSSLQLFTFGIFLPHRQDKKDCNIPQTWQYHRSQTQTKKKSSPSPRDHHQAKTINYSVFLSFITCYHFGYHWEHHQHPYLPWYKLPLAHQHYQKLAILKQKTMAPVNSL